MSIQLLEIDQDILDSAHLTADQARVELAIYLYSQQRLSFGKARELAGLPLWTFRQMLAARPDRAALQRRRSPGRRGHAARAPLIMIVVSNTSPLTNLAAIDQFHLLEALYGQVWIPSCSLGGTQRQ
jgi:predicted HTH domain antitoxin